MTCDEVYEFVSGGQAIVMVCSMMLFALVTCGWGRLYRHRDGHSWPARPLLVLRSFPAPDSVGKP
jgi:hypothetical protein